MSDEKKPETPKPIVVGKPKYAPNQPVRFDNPPLHLVTRVVYSKFMENPALGDKCEWQYMLEGNPQGLIPENRLTGA